MSTSSKIVFSALLVFGAASAALASEDPTSRLSDRYPFLEQQAQRADGTSAFALAPARRAAKPFTAREKALFDRINERKY